VSLFGTVEQWRAWAPWQRSEIIYSDPALETRSLPAYISITGLPQPRASTATKCGLHTSDALTVFVGSWQTQARIVGAFA